MFQLDWSAAQTSFNMRLSKSITWFDDLTYIHLTVRDELNNPRFQEKCFYLLSQLVVTTIRETVDITSRYTGLNTITRASTQIYMP